MIRKTIIAALMGLVATPAFAGCGPKKEVETLAAAMYFEARGEGADGMQLVGETILNRTWHPAFPDTVCAVVYQPRQFSYIDELKDLTPRNKKKWNQAVEIAEGLLNGEIEYFDNGALFYLNPDEVLRRYGKLPRWARVYPVVGKVGKHVFYSKG